MENNKLTQKMKRHAVIIAIHANHSNLENLHIFESCPIVCSQSSSRVRSIWWQCGKCCAKNIKHVQTQNITVCTASPGHYWWRPFKVHKGHIERSSGFWVHNPSHCPRRHPVQVIRDAQRSVYVCTHSRTAIHLGTMTSKQVKTFWNLGYALVLFWRKKFW